ncbi:MAG: RagB/SusD family nutrient uptake outer membrane protein [Prevotella sp.]|nr:RagB/SusD family nutrient uptake outer membrane protein [Prevotella sp.]
MKKKILSFIAVATLLFSMTSCIKEIDPQSSTVTKDQVANAPGAFQNAVDAITASLCGSFTYAPSDTRPYDIGLPGFYLIRDVMGQDVVYYYQNWFASWYQGSYLGPSYAYTQLPWTYYYKWIKSCNEVISLAGEEPEADKIHGAGIAYCMRAYFYQDLAQMFAPETYAKNKQAETVPVVTEKTALTDLPANPRATNEAMWEFILSDLDKAEQYLEGYTRTDVYTPDKSVVYGLKARAYLIMEDWANAEKYAKLAQAGYTVMDEAAYTDWDNGFNKPNGSWMLGLTYKADDPNILLNDADSSWGSMMCMEINPTVSGCGYAANYHQPFTIDRHLYETIPATDWRKKCYIDFAIEETTARGSEERLAALSAYTKHPDWLDANWPHSQYPFLGGINLKFRTAGGEEGRDNQYIGFTVAVPMMRVEEMKLIEIEAAGMQSESRGIQLLTEFAKTRDANYEYGQHNEAYGNTSTKAFQNEVWWQRRVEFWGEGLATYDIKRLNKGVIRSYKGTTHPEGYRQNTTTPPDRMTFCIVQTETNYNTACTNNATPVAVTADSPEYAW